eukprot:TRINITY_DN558_c0_g1_i1.p1 TRINITY_DN558_c0_g1~~TRINITY_DN558_c0_g1_i1.p1  ORF type:complete len:123 (-),score=53.61 TRINITY_DN558_c0_g1_i1:92-460(-)
MAAVAASELSGSERDELLVTYAALVLHDDGSEISAAKLNSLITAAGAKVEPYWPTIFAKLLAGKNVDDFLQLGGGGVGPAVGGAGATAAAGGDGAAGASSKEDKKAVEEEEEEEDMDFDLFG